MSHVSVAVYMIRCDGCGKTAGPYYGGDPVDARTTNAGWRSTDQPNKSHKAIQGDLDYCPSCEPPDPQPSGRQPAGAGNS